MAERTANGRKRWATAAERVEELKAVLPGLSGVPAPDSTSAPVVIIRLADALEALRRARIRDQIRVAGLQEFTESLLRQRDAAQVLEMLVRYLRQVFALEEILLLRRSPSNQGWTGFHVARGPGVTTRIDPFPWHTTWSEPLLRGDPAAGRPEGLLPRESPARYALVIPLEGRGIEDGQPRSLRPHPPGADGPIGVLALNAAAGDSPERDWTPLELARSVESILEILWHREEMETAASLRRQLLEGMQDGILAVDPQGEVVAGNAAAARLLGLERAGDRLVTSEDLQATAPALCELLSAALSRGEAPPPRELALGPRDAPAPVRVAVSGLRDDGGGFRGLVVNLTDFTGIRSMEEEIRRLDRLAAIGRFAAGMAHEIRNPLAGIGAGVEFLAARLGDSPADREDLRLLRAEIRRLDRIVSELLDYTRPRPLLPRPVLCAELAARVTLSLAPLASQAGVRLATGGPGELEVWADPDRAAQVLINLARNAVEASPAGGQVTFSWSEESAGALAAGRGGVAFRVHDEGPGLSPTDLARAFEPFYTTKSSGTGLGLALCHSLVEQHHGKLTLNSAPGEGTTAIAVFPPRDAETVRSDVFVHSDRR